MGSLDVCRINSSHQHMQPKHCGSSGDDNLFIQTNTDHALCQRLARARKILQLLADRCFRSLAFVAPQSKQKPEMEKSMFIYRAAYSFLVALAHLPRHRIQFLLIRNLCDAQCTSAIVIQSSLLRIRAFRFLFRVCFFSLLFLRCVQCLHFLLRVYDRPGDCMCVCVSVYRSIYSSTTAATRFAPLCTLLRRRHTPTQRYPLTKTTKRTQKNRNRAAHRFCVQIAPDESAGSYNLEVEVFARKKPIQRKIKFPIAHTTRKPAATTKKETNKTISLWSRKADNFCIAAIFVRDFRENELSEKKRNRRPGTRKCILRCDFITNKNNLCEFHKTEWNKILFMRRTITEPTKIQNTFL